MAASFAASAHAQVAPPIPNRPSATLLLPYFEVDLDNPQGMTTLFSVNNASATAILAHVVIWSDLGVPAFTFNVYLTGYDVQSINLRDVFNGTAPRSASAGQDPGDNISNKGDFSQDINFASCSGQLPPPPIPAIYIPYFRSALAGGPSSFHLGKCIARNYAQPGIVRGYVTVDTVNNCTLRMPGEPGYFGFGGTGDATNQNVMWGDYLYSNPSQNLSSGDTLVNVTANAVDPETSTAGQYTFYGRLDNWTAIDNREPLSTSFATRFVAPKDLKTPEKARRRPFLPAATELIVWRDPKVVTQPFTCGTSPAWYPLAQNQIRAFNEQEQTEELTFPSGPFPSAAQRVSLSGANLPTTFSSGFLYLNLNTVVPTQQFNEDLAAAQAWVTVLHHVLQGPNGGRYEAGFRAIRLDSARQTDNVVIP
jgi:hypothetical protein